jgi:hypothetical protein
MSDRQLLIDAIEWLLPESGTGMGICAVANMFMWATADVAPENDLKSVVVVKGPPDKYTDEELAKLLVFSRAYTAYYDEMFTQRIGANLIIFDKRGFDGAWLRKRMTWDMGPMYSKTLDEAIAVFEREGG